MLVATYIKKYANALFVVDMDAGIWSTMLQDTDIKILRDCPLEACTGGDLVEVSDHPVVLNQRSFMLKLNPTTLEAAFRWFDAGCDADPLASLQFPPSLAKQRRAEVHRIAASMGLQTVSKGVADERCVHVLGPTASPRERVEMDAKTEHQCLWMWRWGLEAGLTVSRDEVREMVVAERVPHELQVIWEQGRDEQRVVEKLCAAVHGDDDSTLRRLVLDAGALGVVQRGVVDVLSGATPLHLAAANGHVSIVELLLELGAPLDAQDHNGLTALEVARGIGNRKLVEVLIKQGARDPQNPDQEDTDDLEHDMDAVACEKQSRDTICTSTVDSVSIKAKNKQNNAPAWCIPWCLKHHQVKGRISSGSMPATAFIILGTAAACLVCAVVIRRQIG